MAHNIFTVVPVGYLLIGIVVFAVARWALFELTTGGRRRQMIRDNGCKPPFYYPHKGIGGKLFGLDVLQALIKSGKEGRMHEASRLRNWGYGKTTLQAHVLETTFILTIDPENIKTILSTNFNDYGLGDRRGEVMTPVFGHGIFTSNGSAWERSRALIRPNFVRAQVSDLDALEVHVSHLIDAVPRDGSSIDLQDLFFRLTMDSATEFLFGQSANTLAPGLETKSSSEFVDAFVYVTENMAQQFRQGFLSKLSPNWEFKRSTKIIHDYADEVVRDGIRRRQNGTLKSNEKDRYVFLHELLNQTQDIVQLRSELLNVLLAGRDTTAGLLANTFHVLARRPDIWAKLRAEVDELGGHRPSYAEIKDMRYLRYLLNESLRLMPSVPGNSRQAIRDTIIPRGGGEDGKSPILVKKGISVSYNVYAMHRRKDFYGEDALEFKPERWENLRPGWEYLPFNGGPRICIGQQFALMEASYTTIRLLQTFPRIEARDDRPWKEFLTLTLASGTGTHVAFFEK